MDTSKPDQKVETPLRAVRKKRGLTLQELAEALKAKANIKTDTGNLSRMENGAQVSVEMAAVLADFYGRDQISELEILYPDRYMKEAA